MTAAESMNHRAYIRAIDALQAEVQRLRTVGFDYAERVKTLEAKLAHFGKQSAEVGEMPVTTKKLTEAQERELFGVVPNSAWPRTAGMLFNLAALVERFMTEAYASGVEAGKLDNAECSARGCTARGCTLCEEHR